MAAGGAEAYFAFATLSVMALSALMYWRYAQKPFSLIVAVPVFASWTLGLLSTAALPYDVVQSSDGADKSLENMWYGIYWSTWLLSWVVNPLIGMALSRYEQRTPRGAPQALRQFLCAVPAAFPCTALLQSQRRFRLERATEA